MTLLLEERAKIEADRLIEPDNTAVNDRITLVQPGNTLARGTQVLDLIHDRFLDEYLTTARRYQWYERTFDTFRIVSEAVVNAMLWGNYDLPQKRVFVDIEYGLLGSAIFIRDEGRGFDYRTTIERYCAGEKYFQRRGGGMRTYDESPLSVSFHGSGNIVSIATPPITREEMMRGMRQSRR